MSKPKLSIHREVAFRKEGTNATVYVSRTGGPVANLVTGREPHPTGRLVCVRGGSRGMPYESMKAELPAIMLAEVASPVKDFLVQPHRLDFRVLNSNRPIWSYRPDLKLTVDSRFIRALASGIPFARAAVEWRPDPQAASHFETLIIEAKDDDDPRNGDVEYETKLTLAAEIYSGIGWHFAKVVRSRDLDCGHIPAAVREIFLDALTTVGTTDVAIATDAVSRLGVSATYDRISESLAGGPLGRGKLAALHVRRVVSLDLSRPLCAETAVRLVQDGAAILKRS